MIDIEVAAGTPSPTVDPSVRVVLCGHSMGGIVSAETVIALTSDRPIPPPSDDGGDGNATAAPPETDEPRSLHSLMFPYIQGVLSFDTPYLGISPGVVAHGAEEKYTTASAALTQLSGLSNLFWPAGGANKDAQKQAGQKAPVAALPAAGEAAAASSSAAAATSAWGKWGTMAMYAGAAGALAAGGAAAYLKRDQLTEGWSWVSSHLEFVGCLAKGEELRRRVAYMARCNRELGVGFGNIYTRLGKAANDKKDQAGGGSSMMGTMLSSQRTFCNLPSQKAGKDRIGAWEEALNDQASDETWAHMSMFEPRENPGYDKLSNGAAGIIAEWTKNDWYESSGTGQLS